MLRFYPVNGHIFMVTFRQLLRVVQTRNTSHSILVAVFRGKIVPILGFLKIDWYVYADLIEIAHGKLSSRKTTLSCPLCVLVRQLFIFGEAAFVSAQKPFADGHFSFSFSLSCSQCIVMQ